MGGVPIQCQAAGTPLPAPGQVPFLIAPPPQVSAFSPGASKAAGTTPTQAPAPDTPADGPTGPTTKSGIRPVDQPMQPTGLAQSSTSPFLPLLFISLILLNL
jgi:hypothetical protein